MTKRVAIFTAFLIAGLASPVAAGDHGAAIYDNQCASCHGVGLEGQPDWQTRDPATGRLPAPPHDETGHTWHHPDDVLFAMTKHGPQIFAGPDYPSDMPGFGDVLSDDDIVAVLDYIKAQWPEGIRARQADIDRRYRESRQ